VEEVACREASAEEVARAPRRGGGAPRWALRSRPAAATSSPQRHPCIHTSVLDGLESSRRRGRIVSVAASH
jgi:hypothetical protein